MADLKASEDMTSLITCLAATVKEGYTSNFAVSERGLSDVAGGKFYGPEEINVDNFYRFEGASDPSENAILYAIKTHDGQKGTLTDAYGAYANPAITEFMEKVEGIEKKETT